MESERIFVTMNATFKNEEKCRVAMETIVSDAHAAEGVNSHFWFRSQDGKSLFVLEQYDNKKALVEAIKRFTTARISFFTSIKVVDVSVYGNASTAIKLMFAPLSPKYMGYYDGFSKIASKDQEPGIKDFERKRIIIATHARFKDEEKSKVAIEKLAEDTYKESGMNSHFWSRSKDGKSLFLLELYADETALTEHVNAHKNSRDLFFESMEVGDVTVYATVSDEVKSMLAPINPKYMNYYGGYSK
jgi:quinol monooxygenase YgiN